MKIMFNAHFHSSFSPCLKKDDELPHIKGVVNCQNSRDKGPPEGNSARG